MVRRLQRSKILIPLLLTMQGVSAYAGDASPSISDPHILPKAVQLQITPRGMKYFDQNLSNILGNMGVKLDEGYFPAMNYTMDKPINPDDYAKDNPEAVATYKQMKDLLSTWLVGFSLNPHLPTVQIGESGYVAQFSRFGLVTDEALMRSLGKREGAVLAIELEVKKFTLSTASILAWDLNNEFLGKAGLENVTISIGDNQTPLKMRLPFYIRMNANGQLEFEALELENNLDQTAIALQYQKLIVPTFAVEVNGKKFYLNNQEVDKLLTKQAPLLIEKVRSNLGEFTRKTLPDMLNQKAKEFLAGNLEQIQDMAPPGKDATDTRPNFKWGLRLQNINLNKSLNVDVAAYVEDTLNSKSTPRAIDKSRGEVALNQLPMENYDIALSLDRAVINRVLQLSFERRNFEKIENGGDTMKLMAMPTIDYVKPLAGVVLKQQETFVKLHVSIENKPDSTFLKDSIVLDFDIIAKLAQMKDKDGLQLILYKIDDSTMTMDEKYLSTAGKLLNGLWRGKVYSGIREELRKKCATWATTQTNIPGSLPLPPEVLGMNLDINRLMMDQTGHLVMYLNYAKTGVK
ncbi:DUF2785 domain-containing protein [Bdellovibrio svalbardensis]|uniref:DUF2785 domain-containing protein n=1 Tax=Bdellovibrio svalbardensis TaxID=2972972 RepID=A0ABT6DGS0_9BACT|nr:DUF2785 domain-containing protein [Bdellovibrio svalbardensis]MDG0816056.1 DUF2785 domain-containing protein [Bdellovibrio svalbardensis]